VVTSPEPDGRPAPRRPTGLVATAIHLRLALLRGSLRSGPGATGRRVGLIVGALLGLAMAVGALAALSIARGHDPLPQDLSVVLFSALVAGWVVLPILTFGSDDLLDPARLALLPLTRRQLVTVMGVGALVGVAPIATTIAALGLLPATGSDASSYVVALLSVVLLLVLCVSASRATAAALSGLLRSRRGRDLGVALAALVGLSFQLINPFLQVASNRGDAGEGAFHGLAAPLRGTPPGLLATAPRRSLPGAVGSLLVVAAVVALLLVVWERSVRRSLERAELTGSRRRRGTALAPRGVPVPAGRVGAIMAKDLRYLTREPRRLIAALTSGLLPLFVVIGPVALSPGRPSKALVFVVCGVAMLTSISGGNNRFGMDGSATWVLLSSATDPLDARRDLLGGDLAVAAVACPVLLLVAGVVAAVTGGWAYVPPALGIAFALVAIGVAVSGWIAVTAPFAVPPSQNSFASGGVGQGCSAGLLTIVALLAEIAVCLPLLGLLLPALLIPSHAFGFALLVVAPAYGLAVGSLVRRKAASRWATRAPEVLQMLATARG
jgi:ABC-2 type transport system permease protein